VAVSVVSGGFLFGSMSGLMGLGFSTITETRATPFWEALFNAGQFASPDLSFFFTRFNNVSTAQLEEPGGVFTLGGSNSSLYTGDIEFLPLAEEPSFWTLNLSGMLPFSPS
jgi:cathepsin D